MRLQLQKERLSSFVVHDLKNPVASIDLLAQLLQRDKTLPVEARRTAEAIRVEVASLLRLILNLLDINKSEEGQLVEDNPSNIAFLRGVVDELPRVKLVAVPNAEQGIEVIRKTRPQVVIMDINLPGMSGYEATRRLRDWPETRHIPVIALTAAAMPGERKRLEQAGFARYLTKPAKVADLLEALEALLTRSSA